MTCSMCDMDKDIVKGKWCRDCKNMYERNRKNNQSQIKKDEVKQKSNEYYRKRS